MLGVSPSGYYAWRQRVPAQRAQRDAELLERIKAIHTKSRGIYGAPRVHAELRRTYDVHCSRKRVARLMREAGLVGIHRRRKRGSTKRDPARPSYADLVQREFAPDAPDRLWVADITQHKTAEGWLYLAVVIDAYSRKVVGWSMAEHLQAELVIKALEMALWNRRPSPGLVHHSDQRTGPGGAVLSKTRLAIHLTDLRATARASPHPGFDGNGGGCLRQRRSREFLRHSTGRTT